jgi:hypothetical protein
MASDRRDLFGAQMNEGSFFDYSEVVLITCLLKSEDKADDEAEKARIRAKTWRSLATSFRDTRPISQHNLGTLSHCAHVCSDIEESLEDDTKMLALFEGRRVSDAQIV